VYGTPPIARAVCGSATCRLAGVGGAVHLPGGV